MRTFKQEVDEATLLRAYSISTLSPQRWEEVDHELEESLASAIIRPAAGEGSGEGEVGDPLGLGGTINVKDMDMETKAAILISSKSFDPKAFLSAVHPNARYQDLNVGISCLTSSLDSRSEAIRLLVEDNFDRFVAVKSTADAVYGEMQEGLLTSESEYASKPLRDHLKNAAVKANQVYLPVLENASKASNIRATLTILERSKFFLNLPGSLMEFIEAGRYDAAMREYKKGKNLMESRPGQLLSVAQSSVTETQQKRIVEKVWGAVENAMDQMRNALISQLQETRRSLEEQQKTIEILSELIPDEEPVWTYFDSQHKQITSQMKTDHHQSLETITAAKKACEASPWNANATLANMVAQNKVCLAALESPQGDAVIAEATGHEVWKAIGAMVKNLSESILSTLPNFWKIAKMYTGGKFRKPSSTGTRRSSSQCQTMALDIVQLYVSLLSQYFRLSDVAVVVNGNKAGHVPDFVPSQANAFTNGYYLMRTLGEIQECVNELTSMQISSEATSSLTSLLRSARWTFVDGLIATWIRDANLFYHIETWTLNRADTSTTMYLSQINIFQKHMTTMAFKISGSVDLSPSASSKPSTQNPVTPEFAQKVVKAFLDSTYALLDGMAHLASEDVQIEPKKSLNFEDIVASASNASELLDLSNADTRLLLVISNLDYLARTLIPSMMAELEAATGSPLETNKKTIVAAVKEVNKALFDSFIKPKAALAIDYIRAGFLDPQMDWYDMPQPTEIRPYLYDLLIYLVEVHTHVSNVAAPLLDRTLNALSNEAANEALRCIKQIPRFGAGGMLRATLEIEFMQQTLARYVPKQAAATFVALYNQISATYVKRVDDEIMQAQLHDVRKTLTESRRWTEKEFLCFHRKEKTTTTTGAVMGSKAGRTPR